ncbi:hypothetical protein [Nocardia macrotermitis]|uniref:Uncharacterized protein n=1 Tax=Nocardia macrotermitis TaxID=2585198 RepID=A0A7K0D0S7_9NOCA|nr:hypothetical protein [Nocardia macrotermitis]MQY19333.1 hypothetical protein [Nocardia macrotermitis]
MTVSTVAVVVAGVCVAGMVLWRLWSPQTFERWILWAPRAWFLGWWRYRRVWTKRMSACGLSVTYGDSVLIPRLRSVRVGRTTDRLLVRMCAGQSPWDYEGRAWRIADTFGVHECRAQIVGPSTVGIVLRQSDSGEESMALPRLGARGKDAA